MDLSDNSFVMQGRMKDLNAHQSKYYLKFDGSGQTSKGRWTKDEHDKFIKALKIYGKEWSKVQAFIKTRSSGQIRSHAQKFFDQLKKKGGQVQIKDHKRGAIKTFRYGGKHPQVYECGDSDVQSLGQFMNEDSKDEESEAKVPNEKYKFNEFHQNNVSSNENASGAEGELQKVSEPQKKFITERCDKPKPSLEPFRAQYDESPIEAPVP